MPDPDPYEPTETVTDYSPYDEHRFDDDDENDEDNEEGETEANYDSTVRLNTIALSSLTEEPVDYTASETPGVVDIVADEGSRIDEILDGEDEQGPALPTL